MFRNIGRPESDRRRNRKITMNDVNMPSGKKVSIIIPNRTTCNCTSVGENLKLIPLKPNGRMSAREYKIVADEMHKTLQFHNYSSYSIRKIQKVMNCCLWAKFRSREKQIASEVGYVNERMLFHGSPAADIIVKTGFDISQAKAAGWFGRGVYFAKNSCKSNKFAAGYLGFRKMLFCRVALGKMHTLTAVNSTIVQPPRSHHSIEGILQLPQLPEYIVYDQTQAYPEYLVDYDIVP